MKSKLKILKTKKFWIGIILLVIVLVVGSGFMAQKAATEQMAAEQAAAEAEAETVDVRESVEAFGIVKAVKEQGVSVDFNARIDKLYVQAGERIEAGQPLIDFDVTELQNGIADKKLLLSEYKSRLGSGKHSILKQKNDLSVAREELKLLEDNVNKNKVLRDNDIISQKDYDDLTSSLTSKRAYVSNMSLTIQSEQQSTSRSEQETLNSIERTKRDIERMEKKYEEANLQNGNQVVSTIKNGVISVVNRKEGDYVDRDIQILSIVDLDTRIIEADISEVFIKNIKVGQEVDITSDADPEKQYKGKVARIWGVSENRGGETIVPIEISIDNIDDDLLLNFNVNVNIFTDDKVSEVN